MIAILLPSSGVSREVLRDTLGQYFADLATTGTIWTVAVVLIVAAMSITSRLLFIKR